MNLISVQNETRIYINPKIILKKVEFFLNEKYEMISLLRVSVSDNTIVIYLNGLGKLRIKNIIEIQKDLKEYLSNISNNDILQIEIEVL